MNELKTKRDVVKSGFNKSCDAILPPLPNAILPPPKPSIFVVWWFTFEKILPEVLLYGASGRIFYVLLSFARQQYINFM